jgi:hypothetical protein
VAGGCLDAGAASTRGMLMGLDAGYEWLLGLGAQGTVSGTMLH